MSQLAMDGQVLDTKFNYSSSIMVNGRFSCVSELQ
jgi:hypothetical protein